MTMLIDLWNANRFLAQNLLEHPFVQGIAMGARAAMVCYASRTSSQQHGVLRLSLSKPLA